MYSCRRELKISVNSVLDQIVNPLQLHASKHRLWPIRTKTLLQSVLTEPLPVMNWWYCPESNMHHQPWRITCINKTTTMVLQSSMVLPVSVAMRHMIETRETGKQVSRGRHKVRLFDHTFPIVMHQATVTYNESTCNPLWELRYCEQATCYTATNSTFYAG